LLAVELVVWRVPQVAQAAVGLEGLLLHQLLLLQGRLIQ